VDITVKGRHTDVPERFRQHAISKLGKLERFGQKVTRLDVEVCEEHNPRQSDIRERVELTCHAKGPVIRAEAAASDAYAALDVACARLESRLRRAADRRRVHHGARTPVSVAAATAAVQAPSAPSEDEEDDDLAGEARVDASLNGHALETERDIPVGERTLIVREKTHSADPMSLDQALFEMELVGHDFFLFVDAACGLPSVVYRRRGYDYGVIRLAE
jgi:ribosomal subunit interface protein